MSSPMGIGNERLVLKILETHFPEGKTSFNLDEVLFILQEAIDDDGRKYILNEVNRRSSMIYRRFVRFLFSKSLTNLDNMVLLTAMKGGGKSSIAIMLAREWCRIIGHQFDPKKYICYSNADLSRKIDVLPPFSPIIADESVRFASSEDWNKRENKELKKKLAQIREKHMFFILCFPLKVQKVEKTYLESFVNYWIEVYARGYGAVFVRDSNPVFDSWRLDAFRDIGSYNEFTSMGQIEERLKKHPNFWRTIFVPKVPDKIYARYKLLREKHVYDSDDIMQSITKEDVYKGALLLALSDVMTNDASLTMHRIMLHVKNNYDITLSKPDITNIIDDARRLITSVREGMINV